MLLTHPAAAVIAVYIEGGTQGVIQGDLLMQGEQGNIEMLEFSSSIQVPYDPATGLANGVQQYAPIVLTKYLDRATVPLIAALLQDETLITVRIRLYQDSQPPLLLYSIVLSNAHLVGHGQVGNETTPPMETWSLTFESITWTDEVNGLSTTDTWANVAAAALPPGPESQLTLLPPLPNPSTGRSLIRFDLPLSSPATVDVYDLRGRRVARLFDGVTTRERTVVRWNGRDLSGKRVAEGLYLIRLRSPKGVVTQRVTWMR